MSDWIVVVDDEVLNLTNARNILHEAGMRVSCVRSGREFLIFMEKHAPDLVLLDVRLPEMDGFETYGKLRNFEEQKDRKQIPVIFLTDENDVEMKHRAEEMGVSGFVHKPFDKDTLVRCIRNTITGVFFQDEKEREALENELREITQIVEERKDASGALVLGQDAFASIYQFVMRYIKRYQMPVVKVLISLSIEAENGKELEVAAEQFGIVLQKTLRKSDLILQKESNQFFLLLPALMEKHVFNVIGRVMKVWEQSGYQNGVRMKYVMECMDYGKEKPEKDGDNIR